MTLQVTVFLLSLVNVPVGELPPDWMAAKTGEGPGSVWKVVEDATAPGRKALRKHRPTVPTGCSTSASPRGPALPTSI